MFRVFIDQCEANDACRTKAVSPSIATQSISTQTDLGFKSNESSTPVFHPEFAEKVRSAEKKVHKLTADNDNLVYRKNQLAVQVEAVKTEVATLDVGNTKIRSEIERMQPIVDEISAVLDSTVS